MNDEGVELYCERRRNLTYPGQGEVMDHIQRGGPASVRQHRHRGGRTTAQLPTARVARRPCFLALWLRDAPVLQTHTTRHPLTHVTEDASALGHAEAARAEVKKAL